MASNSSALIHQAANAILDGKLVVVPTETVYGLACDATNASAANEVFLLKGRPADNPLIVHVNTLEMAKTITTEWPETAQRLADAFWPGPLSMVLRKAPGIPNEVTGGRDTVAIRMPDHEIAQAIITASGRPFAAPSANRFMQLSPTRVEDIDPYILAGAAITLDGGESVVGIESTVIDLSGPPAILRPGMITRTMIERVLAIPLDPNFQSERKSPGMYPRHYAPTRPIHLVPILGPEDWGLELGPTDSPHQISMPTDAAGYAAKLYHALHVIDQMQPQAILIARPPDGADWEAVWDRLRRAATPA